MTEPIKHYAILAVAGPESEAKKARYDMLESGLYNKVYAFGHPDDYGDYPDTSGYNDDQWESIELLDEDSNLWKYMQKCMDCVLEYVNKRYSHCCDMFPGSVAKHIHWPKKGGKLFFVTGHVVVESKIIMPNINDIAEGYIKPLIVNGKKVGTHAAYNLKDD